MIFNVSRLMMEPTGATRQCQLESEILETEYGDFDEIAMEARLLRTDRTVLVTGTVSGTAGEACARCLEPVRLRLEAVIEEEYYPFNADLMDSQSGLIELHDQVFRIDERNDLDLSEAVRQALTGSIPIAPLCRPECKGLCPNCSADRNAGNCHCQESSIDPRWSALVSLEPGNN